MEKTEELCNLTRATHDDLKESKKFDWNDLEVAVGDVELQKCEIPDLTVSILDGEPEIRAISMTPKELKVLDGLVDFTITNIAAKERICADSNVIFERYGINTVAEVEHGNITMKCAIENFRVIGTFSL